MKTHYSICFLFLFMGIKAHAQVPDSTYYERLFYTCKAWGHVKYYHSEVAAGNVNWDQELINAIDGIRNAPDNSSFNDSLSLMLNATGITAANSGMLPIVPDSLNNNTDYSWIDDVVFESNVSDFLDTVRVRFLPQSNVYVDEAWVNGNPTFDTCMSSNKSLPELFKFKR